MAKMRRDKAQHTVSGGKTVWQPVTRIGNGSSGEAQPPSPARILAAQAEALAVHSDVRVIAQMQKGLGLR